MNNYCDNNIASSGTQFSPMMGIEQFIVRSSLHTAYNNTDTGGFHG